MGRPRGLEPPTPGTTNQCSNQLSYDRHGFDIGAVPVAAGATYGCAHVKARCGPATLFPSLPAPFVAAGLSSFTGREKIASWRASILDDPADHLRSEMVGATGIEPVAPPV